MKDASELRETGSVRVALCEEGPHRHVGPHSVGENDTCTLVAARRTIRECAERRAWREDAVRSEFPKWLGSRSGFEPPLADAVDFFDIPTQPMQKNIAKTFSCAMFVGCLPQMSVVC